ncbi:putative biotin-dependent carboxyltransferase (plasmid) [Natrialba magadii ATCC 43099]|uniref:Allophanate hydrolase subunit 1 n=1 Tax=Natrialba magadii (strain ATCC 43099 / DSM 3394 / CCM 3739 / CIP 104546 / IAM 13178 / JCM 8861 / NBRC 102185 / NCIMB 2190 / MS3) TaxID=547559 RepID=D3T1W2_NATMM|nr:carboxyltransferase domain-containing protein [Natrialba magadii]ADD07571.1 putative biotin-dependent carboxyltransferase [Natrialba magadii ATCC 43099]ELY27211.1 allophanate hydrolase subunit 1 [Natrialba magadii ATCC 43099]
MGTERITPAELPDPRYEYGADDHVFVELAEEMSFTANFKAMAITQQVAEREIDGIVENCPANASYMVRIDPDVIHPDEVIAELKEIEASIDIENYEWETRIIDIPVLFADPWTHETVMEFRERHQDPDATDLEYSAELNGFDSAEDFIDAFVGAPHMVTMVGFVPGLPWCFQMVPRSEQLEVPKYVEPRTDTPSRAVGFGGAFSVVYPVQGAGGYQLYGRTPVEVLDTDQTLPDFGDSMVLPNPGDILNYRRIDRDEYDAIREEVEAGTYEYTYETVEFSTDEFFESPHEYNEQLVEVIE